MRLTRGNPTALISDTSTEETIKPNRGGRSPIRRGTEGDRSIGSTYDSGPTKPGNSAEDKTLKIRPGSLNISAPSAEAMGSYRREVI